MNSPKISIIIPSLDGNRDGNVPILISQLKSQTYKNIEIIVVKGVRPNGKARNVGARRAEGDILISIDDDVTLGHDKIIENIVSHLESNKNYGLLGISKRIPDDSNWFQRRCSKEIPRSTLPIYDELTEGDLVDHTCIAIRRDIYFKVGMENENLIRGTDPDLRHRIRQAGYKIAVIPASWGYHPMPKTFYKLLKTFFKNGMGSCWVQRCFPALAFNDSDTHTSLFQAQTGLSHRILYSALQLLLLLYKGNIIYLLARISYGFGFLYGAISKKSGDPWYDSSLKHVK
jgi:glycosyltransferase involved in cell wall biosynthesis